MSQGLPVSRLINVNVILAPLAAQAPNLNTCLIIGTSDVIDVNQRIRTYTSLAQVAADFGTAAPEYLAAALFFGQTPQPASLYIGRWANVATHGLLETGIVSVANQANAVWNAINPGAFFYYNNGIPRAITGLNFAATANMNAVAAVIQVAVAAQDANTTCVWDAVNQRFVIESGTTGLGASISYLAAPTAVGNIVFAGQPVANDTLTFNGTAITFVAGAPAALQCQIAGTLALTLVNLLAVLQASADVQLVKFQYATDATHLYLNATASGAGGNALTLAKACANATLSGATLAGATGTDISHIAAGLSTDGGTRVGGIAAETPVQAVAILDNNSLYWYMGMFADTTPTVAQLVAVAGYIEAANNKHIFGVTTTDQACLDPTNANDIASQMQALGYTRTMVQYSLNPYATASFFGRGVTVNFNGNNTVITMMYKTEPGIIAENLTNTAADALKAKRCNVFVNYNNNAAIIQYGAMSASIYFDDRQNIDWLSNQIQTNVFNLLYQSTSKIPQTDPGNHLIANAIESACVQAVANGMVAPGQWNANGFGQLVQGAYLDKGYYIYAPPIYLQNQADREARKSVPFQVAVKLAGAVQTVDVALNVNR